MIKMKHEHLKGMRVAFEGKDSSYEGVVVAVFKKQNGTSERCVVEDERGLLLIKDPERARIVDDGSANIGRIRLNGATVKNTKQKSAIRRALNCGCGAAPRKNQYSNGIEHTVNYQCPRCGNSGHTVTDGSLVKAELQAFSEWNHKVMKETVRGR